MKLYHLDIAHGTKINYLSGGLQDPANLIFHQNMKLFRLLSAHIIDTYE